jgi:hypothetical protein
MLWTYGETSKAPSAVWVLLLATQLPELFLQPGMVPPTVVVNPPVATVRYCLCGSAACEALALKS